MGRIKDYFKRESRADRLLSKMQKKDGSLFPSLDGRDAAAEFEEELLPGDIVAEVDLTAPEQPVEVVVLPRTTAEIAEGIMTMSAEHKGAYIVGSEEEKATARFLRDTAAEIPGVKARMEPFYARKLLGKGSFIIAAVVLLAALIFYFAYVPISLIIIIVAFPAAMLLVVGYYKIGFLLPKKNAYNVVAVLDPGEAEKAKAAERERKRKLEQSGIIVSNFIRHDGFGFRDSQIEKPAASDPLNGADIKRTVVISTNYDNEYGTNYSGRRLKKLTGLFILLSVLGAFILFVFCIIRLATGTLTMDKISGTAWLVTMTVIPIVFVLPAVFFFATYTSRDKRNITENNLLGTLAGAAVLEYFSARPDELPPHTRLVYVAFSSKHKGNTGAYSFLEQHKSDGLLINPVVFDIAELRTQDWTVVNFDYSTFKESDSAVSDVISRALSESGVNYEVRGKGELDAGHNGFAPFVTKGIPASTVSLKKYREALASGEHEGNIPSAETVQKLVEVSVEVVKKLG